jgi:hypothetical protein
MLTINLASQLRSIVQLPMSRDEDIDIIRDFHYLEAIRPIFPKRGQYLAFLQTRLIFGSCHTMANIGLHFQTCERLSRRGQVSLIENYLPYILN